MPSLLLILATTRALTVTCRKEMSAAHSAVAMVSLAGSAVRAAV